jgi:hypothetical protein
MAEKDKKKDKNIPNSTSIPGLENSTFDLSENSVKSL